MFYFIFFIIVYFVFFHNTTPQVATPQITDQKNGITFQQGLSEAVEIVTRENEITENSILLLTCVVIFISLGIPIMLSHFESKRKESIKYIIEKNLNKKIKEKESYLTEKIMNKVQSEFNNYKSLQSKSFQDKLNDYSSIQDRLLTDIQKNIMIKAEDIMKDTERANDKQSKVIRDELYTYIKRFVNSETEKFKKEIDGNMLKCRDELLSMQDELFQYMKIEDTLSSRIRDRKAQVILNHWLNAMYQLNDFSDAKSLSLLLKQHIEFIFSLEQLCSTASKTIVDGLFYLEDHAGEVPRSDLLNLLGELKRQQRLNERDVFIPLRRLEIKLQGLGENELDA